MPSTYTHYRFGQQVLSKLPENIQETIHKECELYNIGLHGPDLLFYYHPLSSNPVNSMGYGMHEEPGIKFFRSAAKKIARYKFPHAHLAYIYGFICHFALDMECHGYIDEKIAESSISHAEIEVEFDRRLMIHDGLNPITQVLTNHIRPGKRSARVISELFDGISSDCIYHAMKSYVFYNNLLLAPNPTKRELIYAILRLSGNYSEMHGLIVNYKANPKCRDSNKALALKYCSAVKKAVQLICQFDENMRGKKQWDDLYNYTFSSKYIPRQIR